MEDWKELIKDIISNSIGGIIVLLVPTIWEGISKTILIQVVLIVGILALNVYLNYKRCANCSKQIRVAPSTITGEGGTESILSECQRDFYFMGIAANKWIKKANNFDSTMKKIMAKQGEVRFILLNPMSKEAEKLSIAGGNPSDYLRQVISDNIKSLQIYKKMGLNVRVKVYSHMPVFRVAIVDKIEKVYVGSYEPNSDGNDIQQIILDSNSNNRGTESVLKDQFLDYFEVTWNDDSLNEIEIDSIENEEYLKTLCE